MSDEDDPTPEVSLWNPYSSLMFRNTFPEPLVWSWYSTIKALGPDRALDMLTQGAGLVTNITDAQREYMRSWLKDIEFFGDVAGEKEEHALRTSYDMVSRGDWTYQQALRYAQNVLDPDLTETAWRLRVLRYAKKNGKPPTGRQGRPRKQK